MVAVDPADAVLGHPPAGSLGSAFRQRAGKERDEAVDHGHRSGSRSTSAVGGGERLVEIGVDDVEPHVAGAGDARGWH